MTCILHTVVATNPLWLLSRWNEAGETQERGLSGRGG